MEYGSIRMSRISSNVEDDFIRLTITDELSGISFVSVDMRLNDFADLITNREPKCRFEMRGLQNIGKRREHKHETVFVPDTPYKEKEEAARAAVSLMEVDGWKGRIDDATNHHKFRGKDDRDGVEGSLFSVLFTRFVEINHAP